METKNIEEKAGTSHHENASAQYQPDHGMTVGQYISTRISSLKPPMIAPQNPFKQLASLNRRQWLHFGVRQILFLK